MPTAVQISSTVCFFCRYRSTATARCLSPSFFRLPPFLELVESPQSGNDPLPETSVLPAVLDDLEVESEPDFLVRQTWCRLVEPPCLSECFPHVCPICSWEKSIEILTRRRAEQVAIEAAGIAEECLGGRAIQEMRSQKVKGAGLLKDRLGIDDPIRLTRLSKQPSKVLNQQVFSARHLGSTDDDSEPAPRFGSELPFPSHDDGVVGIDPEPGCVADAGENRGAKLVDEFLEFLTGELAVIAHCGCPRNAVPEYHARPLALFG